MLINSYYQEIEIEERESEFYQFDEWLHDIMAELEAQEKADREFEEWLVEIHYYEWLESIERQAEDYESNKRIGKV